MTTDFLKYPVIIDTDTANEADDQFAVVYAALSENVKLDAVTIDRLLPSAVWGGVVI